ISIVVRNPDTKRGMITAASVSQGIKNNFVVEERWKLILSGLNITLFISVLSGIFGTLFGFVFLILLRVRNRFISKLTSAFINIVQGIPMLILLMVLFYIVFVRTPISPILVSVVAFSVNFGTGMAAVINTCINAIPAGQTEAATAMGYTYWQTLFKILMPQAAEHFRPMLKSSFMTLVKTTSIVGYIAISDLTKVTDVIRSRTYEAFFPLILTAVLYFLISWLLTLIFSMIEVKFDPKRRKDLPKGVIIDGSNDKNTRS
ncbi:MAG: amino acid ABC transporter permease, partial [Clostridia bacterium]|nr:amino acid ABC transporter permease [Clostridia bacterium]